jgi:MoaA/NifB/PqqE/SkfB family radical SAM enzyme
MDCGQGQIQELNNEEFLRQFTAKVAQRRIPISGNLALTHCCNLRCVHCYLGKEINAPARDVRELDAGQWQKIIEQITRAGCLYLLFTGGEPLLRKDFPDIYRHAVTRGLLVTVFTNGMLIDDSIIELWRQLPPRIVEITIYGAAPATHDRVTGVKGSYEKTVNAIKTLIDQNINVKLKTILMTLNRDEFFDMKAMADRWGVSFRFDAAIFPRLDGDKAPIELRVPPGEAVEKEFSDPSRRQQWQEYFEKMRTLPVRDYLYLCGAGRTHFHVAANGDLQPCLMVTNLYRSLASGTFDEGWKNVMPRIRERKPGGDYSCGRCEKRVLCGHCPAFFQLETNREDRFSQYLCDTGQQRLEKINGM